MLHTVTSIRLAVVGALSGAFACAQAMPKTNPSSSNPQLVSIVQQMQAVQLDSRLTSPAYQVTRNYRLFGDKNPNPSSEVWARVDYLPPKQKTYVIEKRVGSSRGEDVVRKILQHESQMLSSSQPHSAIDSSNYSFAYLGEASLDGVPCHLLSLNPKRNDVELVRGKAWVDEQSFVILRIEGQMAKSPSWFLKKVTLKIDFANVEGAWLQTHVEAVADVRFVGSQTLTAETLDARVGGLVAQKIPPAVRTNGSRK